MTTHCQNEVKSELRNQPGWAEIEDSNNVIGLLLLIQDLPQSKTLDKQGTMSLVENDPPM